MCKGFCLFPPDPVPPSPVATLSKGVPTRRGKGTSGYVRWLSKEYQFYLSASLLKHSFLWMSIWLYYGTEGNILYIHNLLSWANNLTLLVSIPTSVKRTHEEQLWREKTCNPLTSGWHLTDTRCPSLPPSALVLICSHSLPSPSHSRLLKIRALVFVVVAVF